MGARRMLVSLSALLVVAAPAFAATAVNPRVKPKTGHPNTTFRVAFTAPASAGGRTGRDYSVDLTVRGRGCSQAAAQTVPQAAAGERIRLKFRPVHHWCLGNGRGTIWLTEGPYCDPGQPCPAFPTSTRAIAHFKFRVVPRGA
jgi:hypothetical protein